MTYLLGVDVGGIKDLFGVVLANTSYTQIVLTILYALLSCSDIKCCENTNDEFKNACLDLYFHFTKEQQTIPLGGLTDIRKET